MARNPLACAEGFKVLIILTLRHLFGVRFCPRCPDCATSSCPCMDGFGSSAMATGGIFGRMDAVFGSVECQKAGTLHLHLQGFVQCFHQFTPLSELVAMGKEPLLEMLRRYSSYSAHVRRTIYADPKKWEEEERMELEDQWPEYKESSLMVSRPSYQLRDNATMDAGTWRIEFLDTDVEALQKHKQHHVHLPTGPNGERRPLHHCRDPKDPEKCKGGFPRDDWLTDDTLLVCPGVAETMGMPMKGKKSMVGLLWGPCNEPNLNGNHPALLAGLRCNGDVQLPYRFPILEHTHCSDKSLCSEACDQKVPIWQLAREAQVNQAAQAGYAADYQNKRLPIAIHEIKVWMKAQQALIEDLKDNKAGYVGARLAKRMVTDCYARGVCRGAVECENLLLHLKHKDPTRAEAVKTAQVTDLALNYPLQLLEATQAPDHDVRWPQEPRRQQTDKRSNFHRKLIDCPFWTVYGGRGRSYEAWLMFDKVMR